MAERTNKKYHDTKTKRLISASQLLNRLIDHANDKIDMTASQVQAAKVVIGKSIPDLKAVELTGKDGEMLNIGLTIGFVSGSKD